MRLPTPAQSMNSKESQGEYSNTSHHIAEMKFSQMNPTVRIQVKKISETLHKLL